MTISAEDEVTSLKRGLLIDCGAKILCEGLKGISL